MKTVKKRRRYVYRVPDMQDANHIASVARDAIEAAREGAKDQGAKSTRLWRAIYGPTRDHPKGGD